MLDFAVLGLFLFETNLLAFGELGLVRGVVSFELFGAAVVEGDGAGHEAVHEGAVVGNEGDGSFVGEEVVLHKGLGIDVEVVGGLV